MEISTPNRLTSTYYSGILLSVERNKKATGKTRNQDRWQLPKKDMKMIAQIKTLKQEHESLTRKVSLMQSFEADYTLDGFFADFNEWLASLDAQMSIPSDDILEDMADYYNSIR